MPLAQLECVAESLYAAHSSAALAHLLILMPRSSRLPAELPGLDSLQGVLKRRQMKAEDLARTPLALEAAQGQRCVYVMVDAQATCFARAEVLRKALVLLLEEAPVQLGVQVVAEPQVQRTLAAEALYVAWVNGAPLPSRKKKPTVALRRIVLSATQCQVDDFAAEAALAAANHLCRELTAMPANQLTPQLYRRSIRKLAKAGRWALEELDFKTLERMGAGGFCAVAQGSSVQDAAIVHLRYQPKAGAVAGRMSAGYPHLALVGKGICYDTGGHNLKSARHMAGMHEDMNGSAVVLGLLQVISALDLPVVVDAWLALAQNHVSPQAYKQNDVIQTLAGITIEIVHTDAEGRMVLTDTLTLATQGAPTSETKVRAAGRDLGAVAQPDLVIDFATLTGSMITALGNRYAGVFASSDELAQLAISAGRLSGERVCLFPMDEDYETALESKVADVRQCTLEGEADHILAACLLKRFTHQRPWLHVDLAAASCSGGLGAVATDQTGFGVAWGLSLVQQWLAGKAV